MSNIKLSIIVCVYNGENDIGRCLESLAKQSVNSDLFEVIVVNNNSTDKTLDIANSFFGKIKNYKVVTEINIGLSNARNRGYKEAIGEYVGYLDDDAKARADYIEKAIEIINNEKPDIFGGPIYPFYVTEKPEWFKDQYEIRLEQQESGFMKGGTLSGSNIIFKKTLLENYGGFDPNLGMKGKNLGYGEETVLVKKAFNENKKIYYSLDLIVEHIVLEFKMNILYFMLKAFKGSYESIVVKNEKNISYLDEFISKTKDMFKYIEKYLKNTEEYKNIENFMIEQNKFEVFSLLGNIVGNYDKYKFKRIKKTNIIQKIKKILKLIIKK